MTPNEVILEVLAEGGSRVLYGLRRQDGWSFSLNFIEPSVDGVPMGGDTPHGIVNSISDALTLFDQYPWSQLSPNLVHPEFRSDVMRAFVSQESKSNTTSRYHDTWVEACSQLPEGNLKRYYAFESVSSSDHWLYDGLD
jgi:hypothetical protein